MGVRTRFRIRVWVRVRVNIRACLQFSYLTICRLAPVALDKLSKKSVKKNQQKCRQ